MKITTKRISPATVWFVAVFANLTALQRIRNAYKQDAARSGRETMAES